MHRRVMSLCLQFPNAKITHFPTGHLRASCNAIELYFESQTWLIRWNTIPVGILTRKGTRVQLQFLQFIVGGGGRSEPRRRGGGATQKRK